MLKDATHLRYVQERVRRHMRSMTLYPYCPQHQHPDYWN